MDEKVIVKALIKIIESQKRLEDSLDELVEAVNIMIDILDTKQKQEKKNGYKRNRKLY